MHRVNWRNWSLEEWVWIFGRWDDSDGINDGTGEGQFTPKKDKGCWWKGEDLFFFPGKSRRGGFWGNPNTIETRRFRYWRKKRNRFPETKLTVRTWKWMVGRLLPFWDGLFSAMLVSGSYLHLGSSFWSKSEQALRAMGALLPSSLGRV